MENNLPKGFSTFDVAGHLETDADIAAYLGALMDEGDEKAIIAGLGHVARAKGMTQIAKDAGLGRASLYKALAEGGNPEFVTVMKVARALGVKFVPVPINPEPEHA